jgi:hypothetical protein
MIKAIRKIVLISLDRIFAPGRIELRYIEVLFIFLHLCIVYEMSRGTLKTLQPTKHPLP